MLLVQLIQSWFQTKNPFWSGIYLWQYIAIATLLMLGWVMASIILQFIPRIVKGKVLPPTYLSPLTCFLAAIGHLLYHIESIRLSSTNIYCSLVIFLLYRLCGLTFPLWVNGMINYIFALIQSRFSATNWYQLGILQLIRGVVKLLAFAFVLVVLPNFFVGGYNLRGWLTKLSIGTGTFTAIVALASQDLISNFFGTLVIVTAQPFKPGDWIVIDKVKGRVKQLNIRATQLYTEDGKEIYIPNRMFVNKQVKNLGCGYIAKLTFTTNTTDITDPSNLTQLLEHIKEKIEEMDILFSKGGIQLEIQEVTSKSITWHAHLSLKEQSESKQASQLLEVRRFVESLPKAKD